MGTLISTHWIPMHRGNFGGKTDAEYFRLWGPSVLKTITTDETISYVEDLPADGLIVVRNHPMSEMYGIRGFGGVRGVRSSDPAAFGGTPRDKRPRFNLAELRRAYGVRATNEPAQTGSAHAATCKRMADYAAARGLPTSRMVFEGLNEPQLWANEPPAAVAEYYRAFLVGLHGYGLRGVVGNFGVGWPGNGGVQNQPVAWDFFRPVIDVMQPGDYLGLHEYWALNGPQENWRWWGGRFTQCPYQVPILITETGIDTGVTGVWYGGWRDLPGNSEPEKARRYVDELIWYAQQCQADGRIMAATPFTWDIGSSEWEKFDIRNGSWWDAWYPRRNEVLSGVPPAPPEPPQPPQPPVDVLEQLRNKASNSLYPVGGIPYTPTHAFPLKARELKLGMPATLEGRDYGFAWQGFAGAILYCKDGDWGNIKVLSW